MNKETFPIWKPRFNRIFSNCLFHNSPAKGWPYKFLSRGTSGSSILEHDFGHLRRSRRIQMYGHSDLGILNNLFVFSILAVWIWYPWLSLLLNVMLKILVEWTLHKNQDHLPQYRFEIQFDLCIFWCFASNSAFFKWLISISEATWNFAPFVLVSSIISLLLLIFVRFHAGIFSNFPFLVHCCFCCRNFDSFEA